MATSVREGTTEVGEEIRILPPEHPGVHRPPSAGRPIAWIVAFVVAVAALVAVAVVEEVRIADRDDTIAALQQDAVRLEGRVEGQQAVIRDLRLQLTAALEQGTVSRGRIERLQGDLAATERQQARFETRSTIFQARAERLGLALTNWVPPVTDGSYGGRMLAVNATADPPRIVFDAIESETAGPWMLLPVAPGAEVTVWSYPTATSVERTEDLVYLDRMFSSDTRWARFHQRAWYDIVVDEGRVTEIHEAAPKA
jgi:hypothetical protein